MRLEVGYLRLYITELGYILKILLESFKNKINFFFYENVII